MGPERDIPAIEAKLDRCRELQDQTECDFTRSHLRELAAELQAQLDRLDDQHRRLGYWGDAAADTHAGGSVGHPKIHDEEKTGSP
jgi:hypothetical protein